MAKGVKIIFLGGVGEIGKNMYALECNNEIIVLDAGLGFTTADMPGIDMVVQDISYLVQNKDKVLAYVITHGHEDHIGGVPHALAQVPAQVFGSRMTLALIENKLREHPGIKVKAVVVRPRSVVQIGQSFKIEFVHVNHSIAGCFAFSIETPAGIIFFTGDFKIDYTPVDGQVTDLARIGEIGRKGVALMLCESTNAERRGHSISETEAGEQLDKVFDANRDRRLFVGTFASNIHRVQQLLDLAVKYNRKIAFGGRSMINVSDTAIKIGEMRSKPDCIIDITQVNNYKDSEILIVLTGSQGEPRSALVRMATGDFPKIQIGSNDTIVFASAPIPGNEDCVNQVINNLIKCGAEVVYESLAGVHASGHAYEDEFKLMISLLNPHYFVPVHGEYKHMKKNSALAARLGIQKRNILIPDLGDVFELTQTSLKKISAVPSGAVLVDGSGTGTPDSTVIRDRQTMAEEGVCVIGIGFDAKTGEIITGPDVLTRGLLYSDELLEHMDEVRMCIVESIKNANLNLAKDDAGDIRNQIRKDVQNYFNKTVRRRPMIITMLQSNARG
jgi:ribonuclease J